MIRKLAHRCCKPSVVGKRSILVGCALLLLSAVLCRAEVMASTFETTITAGPSANRVDIVFLGDGYTATERVEYGQHVDGMLDHMFSQAPFDRYQNFFNAHRIDVISNESGADIPSQDQFVDTALGARFIFPQGSGDRPNPDLLVIDEVTADSVIATSLSGSDFQAEISLITVNATQYGGSGGRYATFAGGSRDAYELALHELGHSFSFLADEYVSAAEPYPFGEPLEVNVTTSADGQKWSRWLGYEDPVLGAIGAFEGGRYYETGIYRPSFDSKMRTLGRPFDAVSREQIVLDIYRYVDPLDDWRDDPATIIDYDAPFWVQPVDAEVIDVEWRSGDGRLLSTDFTLDFFDAGLQPGIHVIQAYAQDNTEWVRTSLEQLQQTITWVVSYFPGDFDDDQLYETEDIDALISAIVAGSTDATYDLNHDGLVDESDRDRWLAIADVQPGDIDLDGTVSFADFLVLSDNFGKANVGWDQGNFDMDGIVGFSDFLVLSDNFGDDPALLPASIPEPASGWMLILGILQLLQIRRARR